MEVSMIFEIGLIFVLFVIYWLLLFWLIAQILGEPKRKKIERLVISIFNVFLIMVVAMTTKEATVLYLVMFVLMLAENRVMYYSKWEPNIFCASASILHVLAIRTMIISFLSLIKGCSIYELSRLPFWMLLSGIVTVALANMVMVCLMKLLPFQYVRTIMHQKEQRIFLMIWMSLGNVYLLYNMHSLCQSQVPVGSFGNPIETSMVIMISIYVVLFFYIKSVIIVGYKEKSDELTKAVLQARQYRDSITKDAITSYEINVTKDLVIYGLKEEQQETEKVVSNYNNLITVIANRTIYPEDMEQFLRYAVSTNLLQEFEYGKSEIAMEYRILTEDGEYTWVKSITNLVRSLETGDLIAYVCIRDIDTEKRRELELQRRAERDSLTGLYNREITCQLVDEHISRMHKSSNSALFMVDVDDFKEINDQFGHFYGDVVLCELGDKLRDTFGADDIIGRVGGDEYIVYIKNDVSIKTIHEKAEAIVKAFSMVYKGLQGDEYAISGSVGVAIFPKDGKNFDELYQYADQALYKAKNNGKNMYQLYDGSDFEGLVSDRKTNQIDRAISAKNFQEHKSEYVFKILYQSENAIAAIYSVLELVTSHFSFERGYIFETSEDGKTTSNTFEWCAPGVRPEIDHLQNMPIEAAATANANFYKSGIYVVKSLENLPDLEREVLEAQNIKSMIQFGIFDKYKLIGFIGFDNCSNEILLGNQESSEIETICNILAIFFVKHRMEEILEKDLKVWRDMINKLNEYVYVVNPVNFEILFMNDQTCKMMNKTQTHTPCYRFFRDKEQQCENCLIRKLKDGQEQQGSHEMYNEKLGIWLETTISPIRWIDGSPVCLVNCTDITKQKEDHILHIRQLEQIAFVDELTGIYTYHKFKQDARQILEHNQVPLHALIKFDVDNFKLINRIYGREKGDEILCYIARALEKTVGNSEAIYARVAADEFVVLLTVTDGSTLSTFYNQFIGNFSVLVDPDFTFKCNFSSGASMIILEDGSKLDVDNHFERANIAQKVAKQDKTLKMVVYDESMTKKALHEKEIENKMMEALVSDEFLVYLQPKYYLEDEVLGGAEALVRWDNENAELFSPDAFISVFEKNGFITKLDFYVLRKVCYMIQKWIQGGIEPIIVSVNFSRLHISNPNFVEELCDIVDAVGIERKYIEIEITETVIYDNIDTFEILVADLHEKGFTISMDDFGSGYSSLGMLKNLLVDVIKMDRNFFVNQKDGMRSKIVLGNIIKMAMELGICTVAEGVEEQQHIDLLRELHCDMVQGYYYAKPMPVEAFTGLMTKKRN